MACTRTLKIALVALVFLAGLLILDITAQARERGYSTVAGEFAKARPSIRSKNFHFKRRLSNKSRRHGRRRSLHDTIFVIDGDDLTARRNDQDAIRRNSHLRDKVNQMRRRSGSKIIRVSEKMKRLGEERAARREAKMLKQIDNVDIRFYRNSEAYDARYPSIVYLELIKK
ncbi:MAG: hypothetical protein GKR97_07500 [Rhizobiaceae bacterium]|nr:hypothetical protein [Rhizobiaceae bacterium]